MNSKIPENVTPLSIYCGLYTRKIVWEEKFTPGDFTPVNMKNCDRCNVRKQRDIKNGEKCITLDISLKFTSLDNIKTSF